MKKTAVFLLVLAWIFSGAVQAQTLENKTGSTISVDQDGKPGGAILVLNGKSKPIWKVAADATSISLYLSYSDKGKIIDLGQITRPISNGKITLSSKDLEKPKVIKVKDEAKEEIPTGDENDVVLPTYENAPDVAKIHLNLRVINKADNRMIFLTEPLLDIALGSQATSLDTRSVELGLLQVPFLYDMDEDSASTGRNYSQGVFSKIIVESDTAIIIREEDLQFPSSKERRMKLKSIFPFKVVVVGGAFYGAAVAPGNYWRGKESLLYGFNHSSIQFFDPKTGDKMQANIEFIFTPGEKVVTIGVKNVTGSKVIEPHKNYQVATDK